MTPFLFTPDFYCAVFPIEINITVQQQQQYYYYYYYYCTVRRNI
jgi:hypothetical protein